MLLTIYQKALFLCVLLLAGTGLPQVQAQKQQAVDQKGQTASRKASLQPNELFSPDWESATKAYGAEVRGGVILNFDAKKAAGFLKKNTTRFTLELPTGQGDETLILHMQRSHIFGKDFKVFTSSNRSKAFRLQRRPAFPRCGGRRCALESSHQRLRQRGDGPDHYPRRQLQPRAGQKLQ